MSVGAALFVMNVPHPIRLLRNEAIGMQMVLHVLGNVLSEGDEEGQFLVSFGCGLPRPVTL